MPGIEELKFSLTKNGYFKVADVIRQHPSHEVVDNINGVYDGINLDRAQIAAILSADDEDQVPSLWDEIREHPEGIDSLVFLAILFSHHTLIEAFADSHTTEMRGVLSRDDLGEKVYTNLLDSMKKAGLCSQTNASRYHEEASMPARAEA